MKILQIHYLTYDNHYPCIQDLRANPKGISTKDKNFVTCQNCRRIMEGEAA